MDDMVTQASAGRQTQSQPRSVFTEYNFENQLTGTFWVCKKQGKGFQKISAEGSRGYSAI